ncbi:Hit family protein 1 [Nosema bombycis CQ1]|uniref:Hit family protein 1 n=1 Tax=Nosema bombycis (strain CQ1 / CVCC 102059) TaxID=578461 RepID=R0KMM3_NOSB1|nr:Hit family protein 1 [Nosema bombycis CQ1]|eukprot:EOB11886.1 Hit family protein 1 [Nosema bombycis CQ1]
MTNNKNENDESNCIFCKLIKDNPNIIYESLQTVVLLDRFPLGNGHLLVIPKIHCEVFDECPLEYIYECMDTIKTLVKINNLKSYNLLQNNRHLQSVKHVHFHIIPDKNLKIDWETLKMGDDEYEERVKEMRGRVNKKGE